MNNAVLTVGVLALQGDFAAHSGELRERGFATREIRSMKDLDGIAGLVLPGGESTTMLKLLNTTGLFTPLQEFCRSGRPVFATCAGLILLAKQVESPVQTSLAVLDVTVHRNGYGRQLYSGTVPLTVNSRDLPTELSGCFIRAPRLTRVGPGVEVLAQRGQDPVLIRSGKILAACFHPELTPGHPVLDLFAAELERSKSST